MPGTREPAMIYIRHLSLFVGSIKITIGIVWLKRVHGERADSLV